MPGTPAPLGGSNLNEVPTPLRAGARERSGPSPQASMLTQMLVWPEKFGLFVSSKGTGRTTWSP